MNTLGPTRLRRAIRHHGAAGLARQSALRLRDSVYLDEHHVWYVLDLDRVEQLPLAEGYELRLAGDEEVDLIGALDTVSAEEARARHSAGVQLWLVLRGAAPAFSCWIYPRETPLRASSSRILELPPGVASLEDSFTDASHRGRGIAGAAWTAIALDLARHGDRVLITKVEVENVPSRRAVEKAGFRAASVMHLRRRGLREHVDFEWTAHELNAAEHETAEQIERSLRR
jgi:RimJ/RimL family protein N-acetyltransferase